MTKQEFKPVQDEQLPTTLETAPEMVVATEPRSSETAPASRVSGFASEFISTKNVTRAALIGVTVATLAFEQGPANESLRANIALDALEGTGSALWAGGAVAAATMAIEGTTSAVVAVGLHQERDTVRRIAGRFKKKSSQELEKKDVADEKSRTLGAETADLAIALGVGPAIAMTKRHIEDNEPSLRTDLKRGMSYSAIGAAVSGGIGYLVTGGFQHAESVGLEKPAEYVIEYGADTRFWMGVVAVIYGYQGMKMLVNRSRNPGQGAE